LQRSLFTISLFIETAKNTPFSQAIKKDVRAVKTQYRRALMSVLYARKR
jgi:hypothetical protein